MRAVGDILQWDRSDCGPTPAWHSNSLEPVCPAPDDYAAAAATTVDESGMPRRCKLENMRLKVRKMLPVEHLELRRQHERSKVLRFRRVVIESADDCSKGCALASLVAARLGLLGLRDLRVHIRAPAPQVTPKPNACSRSFNGSCRCPATLYRITRSCASS